MTAFSMWMHYFCQTFFFNPLKSYLLKTFHGLPITKSALHAQRGRPSGNEVSLLEMKSPDRICIRARRLFPTSHSIYPSLTMSQSP